MYLLAFDAGITIFLNHLFARLALVIRDPNMLSMAKTSNMIGLRIWQQILIMQGKKHGNNISDLGGLRLSLMF